MNKSISEVFTVNIIQELLRLPSYSVALCCNLTGVISDIHTSAWVSILRDERSGRWLWDSCSASHTAGPQGLSSEEWMRGIVAPSSRTVAPDAH